MKKIYEQIEDREKELIKFMENMIAEKIQLYCQWIFSHVIMQEVADKESKSLKDYERTIYEELKKIAPLHVFSHHCSLFSLMSNDLWNYYLRQFEYLKMKHDSPDKACYWPTITYKFLEENGYETNFSKRVIQKYLDLGHFRKKKGMGGAKYSLTNFKSIEKDIKRTQEAMQFYESFCEDEQMKFIFDGFKKSYLDQKFNQIKKDILGKIIQGISLADEM